LAQAVLAQEQWSKPFEGTRHHYSRCSQPPAFGPMAPIKEQVEHFVNSVMLRVHVPSNHKEDTVEHEPVRDYTLKHGLPVYTSDYGPAHYVRLNPTAGSEKQPPVHARDTTSC